MLTDSNNEESESSSLLGDINIFDAYIDSLVEEQIELATLEASFEINEKELLDSIENLEADVAIPNQTGDENFLQRVLFQIHSIKPTEYMASRIFTCFMFGWFVITLLRYSFQTEGKLAIRHQPPPVPFFPSISQNYLKDYYVGNGAHPKILLRHSEIAILMYYAPWSLHSMEARKPYMEVAASFSHVKSVNFSAVNCYAKLGDCRKVYKLYSFPVIAAYIDGAHILFNDQFTSSHIFNFVSHLLNPISKLHNHQEFDQLFDKYENVIVGYFPDLSNVSTLTNYKAFIVAAMKSVQNSLLHSSTRFALVQNNTLAQQLKFNARNEIRFFNAFTSNVQSIIQPNFHTKSNEIFEWAKNFVDKNSRPLVEWLNFADSEFGGKSDRLQSILNSSAALILFTNDYGGFARSRSFGVLRQVALDYLNCDEEDMDTIPVERIIPSETELSFHKKAEAARKYCRKEKTNSSEVMPCCDRIVKSGICKNLSKSIEISAANHTCGSLLNFLKKEELCGSCCKKHPIQQLHKLKFHEKHLCEWYRMLRKTGQSFSEFQQNHDDSLSNTPSLPVSYSRGRIFGLSCKSNETLHFLAINKNSAGYFLKTWNLDVNVSKEEDLVALVSTKREMVHRLRGTITRSKLEDFISSFHSHQLPNIQRSEEHRKSAFSRPSKDISIPNSALHKLTSITFQDFLHDRTIFHDSVIFFSSGSWHGPSTGVVYMLHILSNYFRDFDTLIKFYIIDVSRNSLPYQYSFDRLPALMFIPSRRNMNSARFPSNLPFTVPNLLAFILSRSQPELRWRIALSSCSDSCLQQNMVDLKAFQEAVDSDIVKLKNLQVMLVNEMNTTAASQVETLVHRRVLQRRSANHLDNMFRLLQTKRTQLSDEEKTLMVKDSLFIRWMLYNHFGVSYRY